MSKIKKKKVRKSKAGLEEDIKFEKAIQYSGWIFLFALIGFLFSWIVLDYIIDIPFLDFEENVLTFSFIVFTATSSAFSFGLAANVKKNRDKKKKLFTDWLIAEFLFCMFAIFTLAVYQW
jgi:apolipoprotein N-acyltransferase